MSTRPPVGSYVAVECDRDVYRGRVTRVNGKFISVFFIDHGKSVMVTLTVEQNKRQRDGIRAEAMSFSSDLTALNITYPPRNGPCFARVGLITQTQRDPSVVPSSNDWPIHRPPSGCRVIAFLRHSRLPVDDQD